MFFLQKEKIKNIVALSFVVISFFLTGCETTTPVKHSDEKKTIKENLDRAGEKTTPSWSEKKVPDKKTNPVVLQLLTDSAFFRRQGDYSQAIIVAERALAIDGQEAKTYLELAKIRRAQGYTVWANQLLLKAKRFSRDRKTTKEINNLLNRM